MNTHFKYQSAYQEMQFQPELLESIEKGSIPLLHIENHQFRDRIKSAELSKKGNIYLQHYMPAKQRANHTQTNFQSGHLKEDEFDPNLPHKNHSFWLKVRQIPKEGPPIRYGLGKRTENERIMERVQKGDIYRIDHTAKDTQMIYHPDWKPIQKQNWVGSKNFDVTSCHYQGPKSNPPWCEFPLRINHEGNEYIDGYDKVGENIHRFREKSKEHGRPDFISTVQHDAIGQTMHISQSLRTFKSHKVLGVDQSSSEFSKTKKLTFYKQPLVETKSVDHQVPYQHSQSIRSKAVRDLMPNTDKIYKLSIKELAISSSKNNIEMSQKMINESLKNDFTPINNNNFTAEKVKNSKQEQQLKNIVKGAESTKSNFAFNDQRFSNINSRGSQRTTQYSWNKSRAQTAATGKRKNLLDMMQLKNKLNNDPYYQPSTQETKDLVSKYFD